MGLGCWMVLEVVVGMGGVRVKEKWMEPSLWVCQRVGSDDGVMQRPDVSRPPTKSNPSLSSPSRPPNN